VVAISSPGAGTIAVLLNNGDGTFQPAVKYVIAQGVYFAVTGDFNGEGNTDLVVSHGSGFTVLLGNGDGTFRNPLHYGGGAPSWLTVGDLNGDGKPDLVVGGGLSDGVTVLLNTYVPGSSGSACAPVSPMGN
jgi:hypothetical protein